jgi:MYXO-CTERM domain-containing protein
VSIQNPGINAAQTSPIDDVLLSNVTFKYTGSTISTDTVFGGFGITVKNNDGTTLKQFTAQYTDNAGAELDTKIGQIGLVAVPQGSSIPEPGAVVMGLMGALGLVARRRRSL